MAVRRDARFPGWVVLYRPSANDKDTRKLICPLRWPPTIPLTITREGSGRCSVLVPVREFEPLQRVREAHNAVAHAGWFTVLRAHAHVRAAYSPGAIDLLLTSPTAYMTAVWALTGPHARP